MLNSRKLEENQSIQMWMMPEYDIEKPKDLFTKCSEK